jgi:hypothetical protein
MADRTPWAITAAGADGEKAAPAARPRLGRHVIAVMLLTAAVLDLTRCGLVLAAARHPAPTAGLAAAGLAAAALSVRTARGCRAGRRWAGWAALLIGAASAPQAAASGFRGPYTIPDTATAVVGVLLAVAVLATAGAAGQPGQYTEKPVHHRQGAIWCPAAHSGPQQPAVPRLPPHTGLIGGAGGAGVLSQALQWRATGRGCSSPPGRGRSGRHGRPDRRRRQAAPRGAAP